MRPSDYPKGRRLRTLMRTAGGVHAFDTEVRSLEQAADILRWRRIYEENSKKARGRRQSLKQQIAFSKMHAMNQKNRGKISLALGMTSQIKYGGAVRPKKTEPPHPYRSLTNEQKQNKCREMYDDGNGYWGIGSVAFRRLSKLFDVPVGQIIVWCEC